MIDQFVSDLPAIDKEFVFVTHAEADKSLQYAISLLNDANIEGIENVYETRAGCVIASHCGRGTIGILYLMKEDIKIEDED